MEDKQNSKNDSKSLAYEMLEELKKENENLKLNNRVIKDMLKDDDQLIKKLKIAVAVLSVLLVIAIIL